VNAVVWIAESEGHHPDLTVHYGKVEVLYSTHSIKGLSENDFICAAKIDRLLD
jgi:4a-hydroxytetrahydrobiopterin dehydratase